MKNYIFAVLAVVFIAVPATLLYQDSSGPASRMTERAPSSSREYSTRRSDGTPPSEPGPVATDRNSSVNVGTLLNYAGGISAIIQFMIWGYSLVRRRT